MSNTHMRAAAAELISALRVWRRRCWLPISQDSRKLCLAIDRWEKTAAVEAGLSRRSASPHMVAAIEDLMGAFRMWWAMRLPPLVPHTRRLYRAIERYDTTYGLELADKAARTRARQLAA